MSKVFCIGLSRTGTTSMMSALTTLGYRCLHYPDTVDVIDKTLMGRFDWDVLDQYDAFGDTPVAAYYRELDKQCPDSKFILTLRNQDEWLRSCSNKIRNKGAYYNPPVKSTLFSMIIRAQLYGRHYYNRESFLKAYYRHRDDVFEYFEHPSSRLLVTNMSQGWEPICKFLDLDVPDVPFPNLTRSRGEFK